MGITYKVKKFNKNIKKKIIFNNNCLKASFYTTLIFWGNFNVKTNTIFNSFLLGKRYGFSILNADHQIMLLKQAIKFLGKVKTSRQKILFVNEPVNHNFDGIVKALAFRSLQLCITGKWPNGFLIKKKKLCYSVFFFNPNNNPFSLKEANKAGLPIVSLNSLNNFSLKSMYPIFCNNLQGDSIFFTAFIISNSIIEAHLFQFIKQKTFND